MENSSQALIMAGGILIGIMIISLAVFLFSDFGATAAEVRSQNEVNKIYEFNSQFTSYQSKEDNTIYDVITVANLATENNKSFEFPRKKATGSDNYISVYLGSGSNMEYGFGDSVNTMNQQYNNIIKNEINAMRINQSQEEGDLPRYNCKVDISTTTKRVWRVTFTKR